ncbi:MAG: hypothetical protein GY704_13390, partial [Phycisphaeraceae bacterium]|nr:hypothetical protein [Phycisphaeraceae bacterium]
MCGSCSLACGADTWWLGDKLTRLTAAPCEEVNSWWICDRGRYGIPSENNADGNLIRRQGEQVPVNHEEAVGRALEVVSKGDGSCVVLCGSRSTNEELASLATLSDKLGSTFSPFAGASPATRGFIANLGELELRDLGRLGEFDRAIVLGRDPLAIHPILALRMGEATAAGLAVTVVGAPTDVEPEGFSRRWTRLNEDPVAWAAGAGKTELAGDDKLLLIIDETLVRSGSLDGSILDLCRSRGGACSVSLTSDGFNRRGLLTAAGDREDDNDALLAAL